jgi:RHS repeat-associated protein
MMLKRITLLCLLVFSSLFAMAEPKIYKTVCVNEPVSEFLNDVYKFPYSHNGCVTEVWANTENDPNSGGNWENGHPVQIPYFDYLIAEDAGDWNSKLTIIWDGDWEGTLHVTIWGQRRGRNIFWNCVPKDDPVAVVTYVITRRRENPQGSLNGGEDYEITDEGIYFDLNYKPSESYSGELTTLGYNVLLPDGSYAFKSTIDGVPDSQIRQNINPEDLITYRSQQYGLHTFIGTITDACGDSYEIESAVVNVEASCSGKSYNISLSGAGLDKDLPEGYLVKKGSAFSLEVTDPAGNETDFYDHYLWEHDGGENITQSGNTFTVNAEIGSFQILATFKDDNVGRDHCPSIPPITVFVGGKDWIIEQDCPEDIILPDDLYLGGKYGVDLKPGDPSLRYFAAKIRGKRSIILKPGVRLVEGAEMHVQREDPVVMPGEPDLDRNFIQITSYDEYGRVLSQSRQYFDVQGNPTQSQSKDLEKGVVLASETIYDIYGRAVISTLPAPVITQNEDGITEDEDGCPIVLAENIVPFAFKEGFVKDKEGNPYTFENFDDYTDGSTEFNLSKELAPDPVGNTEEGTLGWYYSKYNGTAEKNHKILNEEFVATTSYPYSRTLYHHDGTEAVKGTTLPGDVFKAGSQHVGTSIDLGVTNDDPYLKAYFDMRANEPGLEGTPVNFEGHFLRSESVDADGKKAVIYSDKEGNALISLYFGLGEEPITKSYSFYDAAGRQVVSVSPNGVKQYEEGMNGEGKVPYGQIDKTTYSYNHKNWLLEVIEPDAGKAKFVHRKDGNIRFSQNAQQKDEGKYSYTNYDRSGRPIESGEYTPNLTNGGIAFEDDRLRNQEILESLAEDGGLEESKGTKRERIYTYYDVPATGLPQGRSQRFVYGAVSYSRNENVTTYYSYDEIGRVEWMLQDIVGLGWKTIDYRYGPTGAVQEVAYQKGEDDQFSHYYRYDANGRLKEVKTTTKELVYNIRGEVENEEVLELQASYEYYLHGPLKRVELAENLQGIDYVYTVQGWLKSINHPQTKNDPGNDGKNNFAEDVFGMTLEYFSGDYVREGLEMKSLNPLKPQYTGNIAATTWNTATIEAPQLSEDQIVGYQYSYDQHSQLAEAEWVRPDYENLALIGIKNGEKFPYKVQDLIYDGNGNIDRLTRNNAAGSKMHEFKYNYIANTNRLESVTNILTAGDYSSYEYNLIGQLKKQTPAVSSVINYNYEISGKISTVADEHNNIQISYKYDDRGFRLMKKSHDSGKETWYIRDPSGQLVSLYIKEPGSTIKQEEVPVYGSGRLGNYYRKDGYYLYEIKDHLGNVRSVIGKVGTGSFTDIRHHSDYYPFGLRLPSRHTKGHRYGYQGEYAEDETEETGWNSFEARMYDPLVGRWNIVDPERQDWSPYRAMGNNPLSRIDKDGRKHDHVYTIAEDGTIEMTKWTWHNYDDLYAANGDFIAGGIRKGILKEGQNFLTKFNLIDLTVDELSMDLHRSSSAQSFILQLSKYYEKEIGGFQIIDPQGKVKLFILPFVNNTFDAAISVRKFRFGDYGILNKYSDGTWLFRNYTFRMLSWFHTHPGKQGMENYGNVKPSDGDLEYTNHFEVPGFIYGGKGGINTMYPQR